MIIQKIDIGSFGKLENTVLNLSGGVNIVRGANESGKSTICNFIKFIFYGLPQKPSEKLLYISWRTSCCRGAITFINDDGNEDMVEIEDDDEFDRIAAKFDEAFDSETEYD